MTFRADGVLSDDDNPQHYGTMLERMKEERVFSIERHGDLFVVGEECDRYLGQSLTRDELKQLAAEIMALTEKTDNAAT